MNKAWGVLAEWEEDDSDGMILAVGIWEVRGGWNFCGLGANVVGAGGRVRWEVVEEGRSGRSFREVCVVELGSGRQRGRCWEGVCMTSVMSLWWKTFRVCVK